MTDKDTDVKVNPVEKDGLKITKATTDNKAGFGHFHLEVQGKIVPDSVASGERTFNGNFKMTSEVLKAAQKSIEAFSDLQIYNGFNVATLAEWKDIIRLQSPEHRGAAYLLARSMGASLKELPDGTLTGTYDNKLDAADYAKADPKLVLKAAAQILRDNGFTSDATYAPDPEEKNSLGCKKPKPTPPVVRTDMFQKC